MTTRWPWHSHRGRRFAVDQTGLVEEFADDHPVQFWICCRLDEPWTWQVLPDQHVGTCVDCAGAIIYRVSARSPTDPAVQKICRRCAERLAASTVQ